MTDIKDVKSVTIEHDGRTINGQFWEGDELITVASSFGQICTQTSPAPEAFAKILLREMAEGQEEKVETEDDPEGKRWQLNEAQADEVKRDVYKSLYDAHPYPVVSITGQNNCDVYDHRVGKDGHHIWMHGRYCLDGWGPCPVEVLVHADADLQTSITLLEKIIADLKEEPEWFEGSKPTAPVLDDFPF